MKVMSSNAVESSEKAARRTNIPQRMDRLPWSRWHWLVIISLGITWILDGLEVTIIGSIAGVLKEPQTVHFTDVQISGAGTFYLRIGVLIAVLFGRVTDRPARRLLSVITLGADLVAAGATAFSFLFIFFAVGRFL